MTKLILFLALLFPLAAFGQWTLPQHIVRVASVAIGTITLDTPHCSAASTSCTLTGVTAGDFIDCHYYNFAFEAPALYVSDATNGVYSLTSHYTDSANLLEGEAVFQGSAAGTITPTISSISMPYGTISCETYKHVNANYLDPGPIDQLQVVSSTANPVSGTAQTPTHANELISGFMSNLSVTPTAGTGYTLIDSATTPDSLGNTWPEYMIQTTATATNSPYTAASDSWMDMTTAFLPAGESGGVIPLSGMYADFAGNTNGSAVSAANLGTATYASLIGGWGGTYSGGTYNTTIAPPNRVSPVWVNGKTHAGTTGIAIDHVSNATESFNWDGDAPAVSASESLSFFFRTAYTRNTNSDLCDMAQVAHGGSGDNVTLQTGYTTASGLGLRMEISNGTTYTSPFVAINPNQWYWVSMQLSVSGTHKLYVYSETTPGTLPWTLLGTSTWPVEVSGTGNVVFQLGNQGSCDSSGSHVYFAYPQADAWGLYGFPVLP
jgi:hypothetical protein